MTDLPADDEEFHDAHEAPRTRAQRRMAPIVPVQSIAGRALVCVIAIMTFLSCLTFGAVTLVRDTAAIWQNQISREATVQIKPADGLDMEAALAAAAEIAASFPGVKGTRIVDRAATARLLEPWLGPGLDIDQLPVPRLVVVAQHGDARGRPGNGAVRQLRHRFGRLSRRRRHGAGDRRAHRRHLACDRGRLSQRYRGAPA